METNIIYNEDCLKGMKKLPDKSIDLIITDPPYLTTSRGNAGNSGGMLQKEINIKGKMFTHNDIDITEYLPEFYRILKDGSHCYIMTNHKNLIHFLETINKSNFHFIKSLIWNKGNKIMGQYYMSQFEYILFLRKGTGRKINNCGTSDILSIPNMKTKDKNGNNIHDTEKPIKLAEILIKNSTQKGDIVVDPFVGTGWVAIASVLTNRQFICWEINKNYCKWCYKRLGKINSCYYNKLPKKEKPKQLQMF